MKETFMDAPENPPKSWAYETGKPVKRPVCQLTVDEQRKLIRRSLCEFPWDHRGLMRCQRYLEEVEAITISLSALRDYVRSGKKREKMMKYRNRVLGDLGNIPSSHRGMRVRVLQDMLLDPQMEPKVRIACSKEIRIEVDAWKEELKAAGAMNPTEMDAITSAGRRPVGPGPSDAVVADIRKRAREAIVEEYGVEGQIDVNSQDGKFKKELAPLGQNVKV